MLEIFNQHLVACISVFCMLLFLPLKLMRKADPDATRPHCHASNFRKPIGVAVVVFISAVTLLQFFIGEDSRNGSHKSVQLLKYVGDFEAELLSKSVNNVLVIDGASFTHSAVDPQLLEQVLAQLGFSVEVIQIALPGSNHFERKMLLRRVEKTLRQGLDESVNTVFLREVQFRYDTMPLAHIKTLNPRLLHFANWKTSWNIVQAQMLHYPQKDLKSLIEENHQQLKLLAKSSLINVFNLGWATRVVFKKDIPIYRGFAVNGEHSNQPVAQDKIDQLVKLLELIIPKDVSTNAQFSDDRWLHEYAYWPDVNKGQDGGYWDSVLAFLPPTTRFPFYAYLDHYCGVHAEVRCLFDQSYLAMYRKFNSPDYWWDKQHIEAKGVAIFTKWLAQAIVDESVLVATKGSAAPVGKADGE